MSSNRTLSLRARLFRSLLLGSGIVLLLTGLVLGHFVQGWLVAEFDRGLEDKARALISLSEQDDGVVELDYVEELMPEFSREEDPEYFQLWIDEEIVFSRSPSLGREAELERAGERSPQFRIRDVRLPDDRPGRQVQVEFVPQIDTDEDEDEEERDVGREGHEASATAPDLDVEAAVAEGTDGEGDESEEESDEDEGESEEVIPGTDLDPTDLDAGYRVGSLVVARGRGDLDERLAVFRLALLGGGLLLLGLIALLIHWTVRLGLSPVDEVSEQVAALDADRLKGRIDSEAPQELQPLVGKLNQLLGRLDEAFERERRFAGDVAHEARTPIAELRSLSDVGGRWPGDRESVQEFFDDVRDIAGHMEQVVEQLLELARADAALAPPKDESVPLRRSIEAAWAPCADLARERGTRLEWAVDPTLRLRSDPGKLERIFGNLVCNAVRHGSAGGPVEISARPSPGGLAVRVANPVDDLEPDDVPRLFDRFWRKDPSRGVGEGSGLGLALVRAFADQLGFGLAAELEDGRLAVTVSIPEDSIERASARRTRAASS